MTRYLVTLRSDEERELAAKMLRSAPFGTRIEIKGEKRTLPQNDRMWAMLTDVAVQLKWHGVRLRPQDWKTLFLDALSREHRGAVKPRVVPNLDEDGFVTLYRGSSDLSKNEMGDLMELISAFGARHGVKFNDDETNGLA